MFSAIQTHIYQKGWLKRVTIGFDVGWVSRKHTNDNHQIIGIRSDTIKLDKEFWFQSSACFILTDRPCRHYTIYLKSRAKTFSDLQVAICLSWNRTNQVAPRSNTTNMVLSRTPVKAGVMLSQYIRQERGKVHTSSIKITDGCLDIATWNSVLTSFSASPTWISTINLVCLFELKNKFNRRE